MSYVGKCTGCYREYVNRRHCGTYCQRCRVRAFFRRHVYIERGGFLLHLWFRPWTHWGYALRIGGRYRLFGGRR